MSEHQDTQQHEGHTHDGGAALDGVGIPACIAAADRAVAGLLEDLGDGPHPVRERITS